MAPNCSAVKCQSKRSDKSVSFHTFPSDALRLAIWLKYCVPGFKPSKHSVLCSLHFDPSLMTWTPRRKSNRLRNSKLNPIDLDANPEAAEPLDDLEIVNFDTPVKVTESHSQHNTSPSVSSHSVRRQLITESTTPIKRARLDKNCETPETPPRKCTSPIEKDYEFDEAVDGAASFINSTEKASLRDRDYFSPNRNSCIDDINKLTEENNRIRQEYEEHIDRLKREIRELDAKHNCEIDYLKQVNVVKYIMRKLLVIKSGGVTASLSSNCSLLPSTTLEDQNCQIEQNPVEEEIAIEMEMFCNEEELNASNIDDAFTNQSLAYIAGYCVVKMERQFDCNMCRKALYDSTEDPLDKDAANIKKLRKNRLMCIPSNSVYKIVLACESVFQMMLSQGLKSSPCDVIAMSTQKVLTIIDVNAMFPSLHLPAHSEKCKVKNLVKSVALRFLKLGKRDDRNSSANDEGRALAARWRAEKCHGRFNTAVSHLLISGSDNKKHLGIGRTTRQGRCRASGLTHHHLIPSSPSLTPSYPSPTPSSPSPTPSSPSPAFSPLPRPVSFSPSSHSSTSYSTSSLPPLISPSPTSPSPAFPSPASPSPTSPSPTSPSPASTTPASPSPASTTPASPSPASTTPASPSPASKTPASPSPASTTPPSAIPNPEGKRKKKRKEKEIQKKRVRHMDKVAKHRICHNCLQKGHMANTCPNPRQRPELGVAH
ncbi:hypothetical protein OUZ56_029731 [Daphnia magna]|uniref:THAP-type domain-containing protein n=1 Tax=Daphnia magna TaxID=35525 RepID=A0ABR0B7P2_9CRUS|nr:hypothetical protein OUZ56_029731 [Daphnia magna]